MQTGRAIHPPPIRVAFGSVPKDGGTFTFYRNLRPALAPLGIDLRCVSVGRDQAHLWDDAQADAGCVLLARRRISLAAQARAFADWCEEAQIDIVMAINSPAILSALPHLPEHVRVVSRCANGFDHGYRITLAGSERLAAIVALSPRLRSDLVNSYGADPARIVLIPNGIAPEPFAAAADRPRGRSPRLELGFVGRLEHQQKGVLHLPGIVAALDARGIDYRLRIAGKGRHAGALQSALTAPASAGRVEFCGSLAPAEIPDFLAATDIFLFTSRFEGMPNALLEAMMAGAVPACFNIPGITDAMLEHEKTGLLFDQEDCFALAEGIAALDRDRDRLDRMHRAVASAARERFTNARAAQAYAALFRTVVDAPPPPWQPVPWSTFRPDPNFPQSWRAWIPPGPKNLVKSLLARRITESH